MIDQDEPRPSRAVERQVDYDTWFISEVEKGLAAADRGDFTDHHTIRATIDSRYPPKRHRRATYLA